MKNMALILATFLVSASALAELPPPVPQTPAAVDSLVYARPFTLTKEYKFTWRKEQPAVKEGYLVVLKVDPALVYARQTYEPVLYAGDQTVERINVGYSSGHVVAILPGKMDLEKTPFWFGTPELPERVNAERIGGERAQAEAADIKPFAADKTQAALALGGAPLKLADHDALRRTAALLIRKYTPEETDLANGLLVPRVPNATQER